MKKNSIFTNSLLYSFGNLLLKACGFFLIPLYTAYLTTTDYGIINLCASFCSISSSLMMFGLQYAVIRYYADLKEDTNKVANLLGTVIWFIVGLGSLFIVICITFQNIITYYLFDELAFFPIVFLAIINSVTTTLYVIYQDILKGMQNAHRSVFLSYVYFFLFLGSNILTVVYLKLGAIGFLFSTFLVTTIMIVVMFVELIQKRILAFRIDFILLKELMTYSLPLIPHTIAFNLSSYATKLIISSNLSLSVLGIFSLAAQFGNVSDIILNSVQSAFQPWFYNILNNDESGSYEKKDIARVTYMLMWCYGLMYILIGVFAQEAIIIMASNKSYIEAWVYVPLIVFSIAVKSPLYFYQNFLYYDKTKTKLIFYCTIIGCTINVIIAWFLVPVLGINGTILADLASFCVRLMLTIYFTFVIASEVYSILKLEVLSLLPMFFMGIALIPSYTIYKNELSLYNVFIKFTVVVCYIVLAILFNKNAIINKYKQLKNRYF